MDKSIITTTPTIEDNQESPKAHYWWLNISSEDWDISEGVIGDKETISSINDKSLSLIEADDIEFVNWLDCYLVDSKENPHFGIPISHNELAISYFDFIGRDINSKTLTTSVKRSIKKNLLKYLPDTYVCNPPIVLKTNADRKSKMRCCATWEYPTNKDGSIRTDKAGNRLPRELSKRFFPKCFYFYRKNEVPHHYYDEKHIGDKNYVQPAPKDKDPEIGYDIKSIEPLSRSSSEYFHKGDLVIACDTESKQITGLLKIIKVKDEIITLQIEEIYNKPVSIDDLDGKDYTSGDINRLLPLDKEYKSIRKKIISNNPEYGDNLYSWDLLRKEAFVDERLLDDIKQMLTEKKCIILQGAPGVGKTYLAKRIAYARMKQKDESRIKLVQFHPNYTYEDFIIGYKPKEEYKQEGNKKDRGGGVLKDGVFKAFCKEASKPSNSEKEFYFIIDEINRGNISKIFGEAFSLLEYRGIPISLAYSQKTFKIPKNVYIIGLMNTADRSLAMIDFALRRRFAFFTLKPAFKESKTFMQYQKDVNNKVFNNVIDGIVDLNKEIAKEPSLGEGFCIGHSYFSFSDKKDITNDRLRRIIEYEIIPIIHEYWFDNVNKFKDEAKKLREILKND